MSTNDKKKPSKSPERSGSLQSVRASGGKKKPSKSKGAVRGRSPVKHPENAEEATLLAWEKTYENRNKRLKE